MVRESPVAVFRQPASLQVTQVATRMLIGGTGFHRNIDMEKNKEDKKHAVSLCVEGTVVPCIATSVLTQTI